MDSVERLGPLGVGLTWIDWAIVVALFALTSWIGKRCSGKQATIRDFFLGGRTLPWYAVAGSIIGTEISAVTLISVPAVVYQTGGNLTYLQLGLIGLFLARWIVALWLVPAYFEREIYSPYDYMARRLGDGTRKLMTVVFSIGGVLGQSARVYLTAVVLEIFLHDEFARLEEWTHIPGLIAAIAAIGVVSVVWAWAGGMATAVWTDAIQFVIFLAAVFAALAHVLAQVDGGASEVVRLGVEAKKFVFFDADRDLTKPFTIWAAVIANTFVGVGAFGVDQMMAQRVFCCRDKREAQKALLASYASMIVAVLVALLGIALYAHYQQQPMGGEWFAKYEAKNDRLLPIYIVTEMPAGLRGLLLAGILAAAISGLPALLTALSQTALSAFWIPWRTRRGFADGATEERARVHVSRVLVLAFGIALSVFALGAQLVASDPRFKDVLNLALSLQGYTQGALLAGFVLAWFKWGVDGSGLYWSVPLSVLMVFSVAWQPPAHAWALAAVGVALAVLAVAWVWRAAAWVRRDARAALLATVWLALGVAATNVVQARGWTTAWPWFVPIGCTTATLFGYLLAARKSEVTP